MKTLILDSRYNMRFQTFTATFFDCSLFNTLHSHSQHTLSLLFTDGIIPHQTVWPVKLLYKSDRDDPANLYCVPNVKVAGCITCTYTPSTFVTLRIILVQVIV